MTRQPTRRTATSTASTHRSEHDHYVAKLNWLVSIGRDDLIDEIADQFERRECHCSAAPQQDRRLAG